MNIKLIFILALTICISACSSSTPAPVPTATLPPAPTPIPLSEVDLESYLFAEGDLPAQLAPGQVRDIAPGMFDEVPAADNTVFLQFSRGADNAGGATVFLFEDAAIRDAAYSKIESGLGAEAVAISNVGEKAIGVSLAPILDSVEILFQRCTAVIHVRMSSITDMDAAVAYGRRLDERLTPVVCR